MFSLTDMPSTTTMLSAYASLTGSMMLIRSFANEFIPHQFQGFLLSGLRYVLTPLSSRLTIVVDEFDGFSRNEVYEAVKVYLGTMISPWVQRLSVTKAPRDDKLTITIAEGEEIIDVFEGIQVKWRFFSKETKNYDPNMDQRRPEHYFELSFNKKHRERVLDLYLPYVLNKSKAIKEEKKVVKLHAYGAFHGDSGGNLWGSVNLDHPATFDTLAMDLEMKKALMEDLEMFVRRKEFYKRVGKAWKRGYLLYGPPGTGKSSLIAAMANYLKFDIYDLELASIRDNYELRRLVVATANRSILVIEDIDCSVELQNREVQTAFQNLDSQLTLSGILNFIDGLWSSCGDERIIVFTTNHKDRLDPALLRPGRMDIHVHMSYCTTYGFKLLASNYLGIADHHHLFEEIEGLLGKTEVTPAEVAEELMKSNDAEISLGGLVKFLKRKKMEKDETKVEVGKEDQIQEPKRQKIENAHQELPLRTSGRRVLTRIRGRGGRRGIFRRW